MELPQNISLDVKKYLLGEVFYDDYCLDLSFLRDSFIADNRIETLLKITKDAKVIHIGCVGHLNILEKAIKERTHLHMRLIENCKKVAGFDISTKGIDYLRNKYSVKNIVYFDLINSDKSESNEFLFNEQWDYILLGEVLEHIDNPVEFLGKLKAKFSNIVQKCIITVPNAYYLKKINKYKKLKIENINSDHRYWFTPFTILKTMAKSGIMPYSLLMSGRPPDSLWVKTCNYFFKLSKLKKRFISHNEHLSIQIVAIGELFSDLPSKPINKSPNFLTTENNKKLMFAIFVDSAEHLALWQYNILTEIANKNIAKLSLIILNCGDVYKRKIPILIQIWLKCFSRIFSNQKVSTAELYKDTCINECRPALSQGNIQEISAEDCDKISKYDLDFGIKLGFGILKGNILNSFRYGVWSFHNIDERNPIRTPIGFWEVYKKTPEVSGTLLRLNDKLDEAFILNRFNSHTNSMNLSRTIDSAQFSRIYAVSNFICDILSYGNLFSSLPKLKNTSPILKAPKTHHVIILFLKVSLRKITFKLTYSFKRDHWAIGFLNREQWENYLSSGVVPQVNYLIRDYPDASLIEADPFGLIVNNEFHLLYERFDSVLRRGVIACKVFEINEDKTLGEIKKGRNDFLISNNHCSYPFIVKHNNEVYVVPETGKDFSVSLFKYNPEKLELTFVEKIIRGERVWDSSIIYWDGKWWLFGLTIYYTLSIWFSDKLEAPNWTKHPKSSSKISIGLNRPGGSLFIKNGKLYRWSQSGLPRYGAGMNLMEITTLNETDFNEICIRNISPFTPEYPDGFHTVSYVDDYVLIDCYKIRYDFQPNNIILFIKAIFRKLSI